MTNTNTAAGLAVVVNADGTLSLALGNGAATIAFKDDFELLIPRHIPTILLVRCDGSHLKVSQNFHDFESVSFSGAPVPGDADDQYVIGASSNSQLPGSNAMFLGDLFWASLYASNLNATQLATMRSCLQSRAGDQA
jgi:hypothetical protein